MARLRGREVVVAEKLNGENTTLYTDLSHAWSVDSGITRPDTLAVDHRLSLDEQRTAAGDRGRPGREREILRACWLASTPPRRVRHRRLGRDLAERSAAVAGPVGGGSAGTHTSHTPFRGGRRRVGSRHNVIGAHPVPSTLLAGQMCRYTRRTLGRRTRTSASGDDRADRGSGLMRTSGLVYHQVRWDPGSIRPGSCWVCWSAAGSRNANRCPFNRGGTCRDTGCCSWRPTGNSRGIGPAAWTWSTRPRPTVSGATPTGRTPSSPCACRSLIHAG